MSTPAAPIPCPSCGNPSSGKFCAECGAALIGATCAACRTLMTPGARFCHLCGAPAGRLPARQPARVASAAPASAPASRSIVPWAVGTIAVLALVITVAVQQSSSAPTPAADASTSMAPFADRGASPPSSGGGAARAPDISSLTPRERADRLYDRVMRQVSEGKTDSATFFAGMAVGAYESLGALDNDLRYDYGRMAEIAGNLALAQAQSDAILSSDHNHLLGLTLGARVAQLRNDPVARKRYQTKLLDLQAAELRRKLDEYERHRGDIDAAIEEAKTGK